MKLIKMISILIHSDTWQFITPCDVLLCCADSDRSYSYRGQYYSPLIDSLDDIFRWNGITTQSVAHRFSQYTGEKAYGQPFSINRELFWLALWKRLISLFRSKSAAQLWHEAQLAKLWEKVLSKSNPKAVISIQPDVGLCRAGHQLGIPVFDLQHGIISDTEDNLYYWSHHWESRASQDLPHGFFCWDEASAETLKSVAGGKKIIVHVIGNPWFMRFIRCHPQDVLVRMETDKAVRCRNALPIILVTLQSNLSEYASDYVNNGVMVDCLETVIHETSAQYNWLLRLHPTQLSGTEAHQVQQYLKSQFGKYENIEWEICSRVALPNLLTIASLHITHFSSTTIEAAWMGVPTGLLDPHICAGGKHAGFYANERKSGFAEALPLGTEKIKIFIQSSLAKGKSNILLHQYTANFDAFIADFKQHINGSTGGNIF